MIRSKRTGQEKATFPAFPLGLPRGNGFRILCTPMTSSRPAAGARSRRMLIAFVGLVIACGTTELPATIARPEKRERASR